MKPLSRRIFLAGVAAAVLISDHSSSYAATTAPGNTIETLPKATKAWRRYRRSGNKLKHPPAIIIPTAVDFCHGDRNPRTSPVTPRPEIIPGLPNLFLPLAPAAY